MSAANATDAMSWPARLGGYDVVRPLSLGGMGAVLLAERRAPGFTKRVAIKVVLPKLLGDPAAVSLFADEARLAARFVHPNLVAVHDFGEEAGVFFMVMELVEGLSVLELLRRRRGPLPVELAAQIVADAARGLSWAHELTDDEGRPLGVVHRDVSPDNIIIAGVGLVKVLDFGIARSRLREKQTAVTGLLGKPPYMAPERLRGHVVDERADAWSLGVILHELLTGRRLFTGSGMALLDAVDSGRIAPLPPATPPAVVDVVMGALRRPLAQRSTTSALLAGLDRFLRERGGLRTPAELRAAIAAVEPTAWAAAPTTTPSPSRGRAADEATGDIGDIGDGGDRSSTLPVAAAMTTLVTAPAPRRSWKIVVAAAAGVLGATGMMIVIRQREAAPITVLPPVVMVPPAIVPVPAVASAAVPSSTAAAAVDDALAVPTPIAAPKRVPRKASPATTTMPTSPSTKPTGIAGLYVPDRTPYVDVYVDGKKVGVSPLGTARRPFSVPVGSHVVTLFEPASGRTILTRTLTLAADEHVVVRP